MSASSSPERSATSAESTQLRRRERDNPSMNKHSDTSSDANPTSQKLSSSGTISQSPTDSNETLTQYCSQQCLHSTNPSVTKGYQPISSKSRKLRLYRYEELPPYLQDNEHIKTGYRANYTYQESWLSIFRIHNETGNIHTHLLGFVYFIGLLVASIMHLPQGADKWDHLILGLFLLSACKCFLFSTLFHTHFCNSKDAFVKFGCLDYAGISILICGSASVVTYYAFYCHFTYRAVWLSLLVSISSVGIFGPMFSVWATPRFRLWRTLIYIASGVLSGLPVLHYLIQFGVPDVTGWALYGWFVMGFTYIFGAMIYAFKIPECFAPGKFDFIGHSHQWRHICVVAAAYVHYISSVELLSWRLTQGCPV